MSELTQIIIRPAELSDKNLILSTWLKGNYFGNAYFLQVPSEVYYKEYAKHIIRVLGQSNVIIQVACDKKDRSWIVGFAVVEAHALHWVYVKKDYRCNGVATLLLRGQEIKSTKSTTKVGKAITEYKRLTFNPF